MIDTLSHYIVYNLLQIQNQTLAQSLDFFIYDTIKIILLLFFMVSVIGFLRTYVSQKKVKQILTSQKPGVGNLFASLFGAITPFCSCSSVPLFLGFLEAGIPLGISLSFLITSPLINEYLVVLMLGFFGWKITLLYIVSGILIGMVSGIIIEKIGMTSYLEKDLVSCCKKKKTYTTLKQRIKFGINEAFSIIKKIWLWILVGVGLGALIHNVVPEEFIHATISKGGILTVPIAALLGIPMYGSCAAIVPVAIVLFEKGVPLGTTLAFMMSMSALSLPEAIILRRAMKPKLLAIFFLIVGGGIILTGYLLNYVQMFL